MDILLLAATAAEIAPTIAALQAHPTRHNVTVCLTGVGVCTATFALTRALTAHRPGMVVAAGIAGSLDRHLALGTVVQVTHDRFGDLGAEDGSHFLSLSQLGLEKEDDFPLEQGWIPAGPAAITAPGLPVRRAITVHMATGAAHTAALRLRRFGPVLESMEGAAFHYVCRQLHVPLLHLRAISNYAEARNRPAWDIPLAVRNLNAVLEKVLGADR